MAGGGALALVLRLIGEGPIGRAVALEGGGGDEMFSRGTQQLGGMVAAVVYGAALGAIFTVAYAAVRHRLRAADDWRAAVAVAAAGFAAVFLLPFLKYPANPPAVGDPDTIGRRTALYLLAVAWSLVATWGGWRAWRAFVTRGLGLHQAVPATLAVWVALAAVGLVALPANPDPVTAPATLIWQFRLATLAGAVTLWSVLGMTFGWLRLTRA
jgi:predicted cobalt transporter CbtA